MDPNATLFWIEDALHTGNRHDALEYARELLAWLNRGGFAPNWSKYPAATAYCRKAGMVKTQLWHPALPEVDIRHAGPGRPHISAIFGGVARSVRLIAPAWAVAPFPAEPLIGTREAERLAAETLRRPRKPYTPFTGARCSCRPGIQRDNCPQCEGTGKQIDFAAIRARRKAEV